MRSCRLLHELAQSLDSKRDIRMSIEKEIQLANVSPVCSRIWQRNSIRGKKLSIKGKRSDSRFGM